jgi:Raf kinase inhibitor-like YbhB/YbcL family protein
MRRAYAVHGILWLVLTACIVYAVSINRGFTPETNTKTMDASTDLKIASSAFKEGGSIPSQYTCDGDNAHPPISISGVPESAKSLALIMYDPDVPKQLKPDGIFDHWIVFNMPPDTHEIAGPDAPGVSGANGAGQEGYTGPCPPPQYEPPEHRYIFTVYALDTELSLPSGATKDEVLHAMEGHIVAQAQLTGRYKKK